MIVNGSIPLALERTYILEPNGGQKQNLSLHFYIYH